MKREEVQYANQLIDVNKNIKKIIKGYEEGSRYQENLCIYTYGYDKAQPQQRVFIEGSGVGLVIKGLKELHSFNEEQLKELGVLEARESCN